MNLQPKSALPRFAVCMAAYNGMSFIVEQIESILTQREVDLHIFISVDLSTDGTEMMLIDWARTEPRLTVLPCGQRFGGAGPNFYRLLRDVDLNGFDYVSLADQDDLWDVNKLWNAHSLMLANDALGYSSNVTAFWPLGKTQLVNKAQPQRSSDFLFEAAGPGCTYVLHIRLALVLQHLISHAGERLSRMGYHDWLIYAFARANDYPWIIDEWSSMQYRQHSNNQLGVNAGWRSYWSRAKKVLAGHGFEQSILISELLNASSAPVVQRGLHGGRLGYLWLALHGNQCRRKRLDQLFFIILCVSFAIRNPLSRGSI